jgi:hypothetical protein
LEDKEVIGQAAGALSTKFSADQMILARYTKMELLLKDYELRGQPNKTSEAHSSLDALHSRPTGPIAGATSANHAYADGVRIGECFGARHALLEAKRWIWQEYGSTAAAPPDTDTVPGSFWDGVRDGFVEARGGLEGAQAGEAGDAISSGGWAVSTARSCGGALHNPGKVLGTCEYPVGRGDDEEEEEDEEEVSG